MLLGARVLAGGVWTETPSPTAEPLKTVKMVNRAVGWAGGRAGTILRYENGAWQNYPSGTDEQIRDIAVVSEKDAWAVGSTGTTVHFSTRYTGSQEANWVRNYPARDAASAQLDTPIAVAPDGSGNIFVVDQNNSRLRRVDAVAGIISTVAGTGVAGSVGQGGVAANAQLNLPVGIFLDTIGNIYLADQGNHWIRKMEAATGRLVKVAGSGTVMGSAGYNGDGGVATNAQLSSPAGIAVDAAGNMFIADTGNQRVRKVAAGSGLISTVAGTGVAGFNFDGAAATTAQLNNPTAVLLDSGGNVIIADTGNHRIRRVDAVTGAISTVAGTGLPGYNGDGILATTAMLKSPAGIFLDPAGNLYIADTGNQRIRKITASSGSIATVAGTGSGGFNADGIIAINAQISAPAWVSLDGAGNIYIADTGNQRVRKIDVITGLIGTIAGTGAAGYNGDFLPTSATTLPLHAVTFLNAANGWAVGGDAARGVVLHYNGSTWVSATTTIDPLYGIAAISSDNIWFCGGNRRLMRFDGSYFQLVASPVSDTGAWRAISFPFRSEGWVVGDGGKVARYSSVTGGWSSHAQGSSLTSLALMGMSILPESGRGYVVGAGGIRLLLRDGVFAVDGIGGEDLYDVDVINELEGFAVGGVTTARIMSCRAVTAEADLNRVRMFPNPFDPGKSGRMTFDRLPGDVDTLEIYTLLGERVASLTDGVGYDPVTGIATWNGAGAGNRAVATGTYYYRLHTLAGKRATGIFLVQRK
jgi:sugar lactone lactonase YvrE